MKTPLLYLMLNLFFLLLVSPRPVHAEDVQGVRLFNGKNLKGWTPTPGGKWEVVDGVLVGTSTQSERRHGILLTDRSFSDFVLHAKFRVLSGDSGLYFRAERVPRAVSVHGFQVEVDTSQETGGLYETGGRSWVVKPAAEAVRQRHYQPGEWTELELHAVGGDVMVKINGVITAELENDPGRRHGHIGLQLHGGQEMHVEYRDLVIRELNEASGFTPMFNGRDLSGWNTTGNWVVENNSTIALKPRPGEHGWKRFADYLTTNRVYGNFVLDLEFKFNSGGNSGVFLRVGDLENYVTSGFEVQILDTHGKEPFGAHDCGGVIGTSAPTIMAVKPAGEWNRYVITLIGSRLEVVLNGVSIQDLDLSRSRLEDRPARGYISFQDEGKPVWYRNVRIKKLD